MKFIFYIVLFLFSSCSHTIKTNDKEDHKNKEFSFTDTIGAFILYRNDKSIIVPDSLKFGANEKGVAIVQLENDTLGNITNWHLNIFRIMEGDSIHFNYSRFQDSEFPGDYKGYYNLLKGYIEGVKLSPIKSKIISEPNSVITLRIYLRNSEN